jgi:HK97 family phage portal protein
MNLWSRVKLAFRALTFADLPQAWRSILGDGEPVAAGIAVNEKTAMTNSAFWCGVNLISSQIATLPRHVQRRVADDGRERDRVHHAARVLEQPNTMTTAVTFWETLMAHALTWGNGYAEIERDKAGRPLALWLITPDRVTPFLDGDVLRYRCTRAADGKQTVLDADDMLHIPGLGFDGIRGYSVVFMARQSLGLSLAAERFGAKFFGNGARPQTVLEHPKQLSPEAQDRLKVGFARENAGERQLGVTVAEEGMRVRVIGIPPDDAQFLETRQFQIEEVARWLNTTPSKLKSKVGERPGGNLEASQIDFLTDTLRPWLVRIEQECDRKLFKAAERIVYYVEHVVDAILRTDQKSRLEGYKVLAELGVLTPEQIARKENLPAPKQREAPIAQRIESVGQLIRAGFDPDEAAAAMGLPKIKHLGVLPVTVTPVESGPKGPPPGDGPEAQRMRAAVRAVLVDAAARFARREATQARRAAKDGPEAFGAWAERFYAREVLVLRDLIRCGVELQLAFASVRADAGGVAAALAEDYAKRSREQLLGLKASNLEREVEGVVERWLTLRPIEIADTVAAMKEGSHAGVHAA